MRRYETRVKVAVPMLVSEDEPVPSDLSAVKSYDDLSNAHTTDDVDYPQTPPVGGRHDPEWLDCGTYDEPLRDDAGKVRRSQLRAARLPA